EPDAVVMIRFLELGLKFSLCGMLVSVVLLPVYASSPGSATGANRLSLSNLQLGGSDRFWCVVVAAYVLFGAFSYLVLAEWRNFLLLR
ncbi:unnamed protein product, partial [Polarella glacialis]